MTRETKAENEDAIESRNEQGQLLEGLTEGSNSIASTMVGAR